MGCNLKIQSQSKAMYEDEQLVAIAKDDPEAFGEIYDKYYPQIFGYLKHRTSKCSLTEEKTAVINPEGFVIPESAERVHGITTERALAEGQDLESVLTEFAAALDASKICVAHNMSFDEKIMRVEFLRKKIPNTLFETEKICTMMASIEYCQLPGPYGTKWPTLSELYRCLFHSELRETHDATDDVRACAQCFFELKHLGIV